ncbi:sugar transferase [Sulfitobacter sp. SK011]|jgi:lipopolysaccharide/colanic/teichoic acid biosynthesis glycosyltransferase|uniref:sugar transferase n=1 Tax=Sulfitobacter sp. SK011 TaxID=1389004 RepID=UPI000E0BD916|nr:sugar transferase [Sulfitobacter sp. SK011]AXI42966.1 sugar transferase [Sulfitobacter sp. SK011]
MNSYKTNQLGYGQFEFGPLPADGNPAILRSERFAVSSVRRSYVWDGAVARKAEASGFYRGLVKPLLDGLIILLTLPFSVPFIAFCAVALWVEGGSPFYTQERLGKNGKRFKILKLRTMVRDADAVLEAYLASDPARRREWNELQKLRNDPRVTRVGHFLRATSMDELPQLFNVLKGDMSLVGPRPMMPEQLSMYGESDAYFALRPGVTGLWQVSARDNTRLSHRNEVDAEYLRNISFMLDLTVLYKTIGVVLRRTGY